MNLHYPTCFASVTLLVLGGLGVTVSKVYGGKNQQQCIPLEIVNKYGPGVGIDPHINNQFSIQGRLRGTLDTTNNCVQGLPPETINALNQAQAQQQGQ